MHHTCPSCGTATDFERRTAHVLRGSCSSCGGAFTIVQDAGAASEASASATAAGPEGGSPPEVVELESPGLSLSCNSCGETMTVRATSPSTLEATCTGCGEVVRFVSMTGRPFEPTERPARRERPSREGWGRREGPGSAPPTRPCRECGGPLSFTTGEDGTVTGQCASCGNRFTLPARRDRDGDRRGGFRGGRPDSRGYGRGGGRFDRRSPGPGRGTRGPPRGGRFRRADRGGDDEDERPVRRRRRFDRE